MEASVIVATYGRNAELVASLDSLLTETSVLAGTGIGFEVIVVDQTPAHDVPTSAYLAGAAASGAIRHFLVSPPSLPAARNFGLEKAHGEVVIFIDDDVIVHPGFVAAHLGCYARPDIGGVAGRSASPTEPVGAELFRLDWRGRRQGSFNVASPQPATAARGCNMSFRRHVVAGVGGFDTRFLGNAMREDTDVSYRVRAAGWPLVFSPAASLTHLEAETGGCREELQEYGTSSRYYRNIYLFLLKHRLWVAAAMSLGEHLGHAARMGVRARSPVQLRAVVVGFGLAVTARRRGAVIVAAEVVELRERKRSDEDAPAAPST